jgi:hypothetical protein
LGDGDFEGDFDGLGEDDAECEGEAGCDTSDDRNGCTGDDT